MENKQLLKFLGGGYWCLNKEMRKAFGTLESLWITHLLEWQQHLIEQQQIKEDEYFYLSQENIFKETGISPGMQTSYIKFFKEKDILSVKENIGLPARNYYYINSIKMIEIVHSINEKEKNLIKSKYLDLKGTSDSAIKVHIYNNPNCNNPKDNKDKSLLATSLPDNIFSSIKETEQQNITIESLSDAEQLFDYWNMIANENKNEKPPLNKFQPIPNHIKFRNGKPTSIYSRALHLIEIRLKRFSKEEIAQTFNLYAEIFYNPDTYKLKSKFKTDRMNIDDFFKIEDLDRASMKSYTLSKKIDSWFDEMIKGRDYLLKTYSNQPFLNQKINQPVEDKYPKITQNFKWAWRDAMELDKRFVLVNKEKDENDFRKASIFLMDFIKKWYDQLPETLPINERNEVYLSLPHTLPYNFTQAISFATESMDDSIKITPSWLHTPKMEERLVRYYRDQGCISDPLDNQDEKYDMEAYNL
jgi:hypothetical protein